MPHINDQERFFLKYPNSPPPGLFLYRPIFSLSLYFIMHDLDCVLTWPKRAGKPDVGLETPTEFQTEILKAMGYVIKDAWVLQQ